MTYWTMWICKECTRIFMVENLLWDWLKFVKCCNISGFKISASDASVKMSVVFGQLIFEMMSGALGFSLW